MTVEPAPWQAAERSRWPSPAELQAMEHDDLVRMVRGLGWPDLSRLDPNTFDECRRRGWITYASAPPRRASCAPTTRWGDGDDLRA